MYERQGVDCITDEPVRGQVPPSWWASMPGIERMRAMSQGLILRPPLGRLLGMRLAHVGPGAVTATMPASGWLLGGNAVLEVSPLFESALLGAGLTAVGAGEDLVPLTLTVNYFRPGRAEGGNLLARARVANVSSAFVATEVELEDANGRRLASASCQARIRRIDPPPSPPPAQLRPVEEPTFATPDPTDRPVPEFPTDAWVGRAGHELLTTVIKGELPAPPFSFLYGMTVDDAGPGWLVGSFPASEWFCVASRRVSCGVIATMLSAAGWGSLLDSVPVGHGVAGLSFAVRFHRELAADGRRATIEATLVQDDPEFLVTEARLVDPDGALVAGGTLSGAVVRSAAARRQAPKRILATIVFTDIVGSTGFAQRIGDAAWRALLDQHHALVRRELARADGVEVKTMGDGFLARFDSPARALECVRAVRDGLRSLGLEIRAGLHVGECEMQGADLAGIAINVAARVESVARPGEILVSSVVRDLVAGSSLRFEPRGEHELKGVPGRWSLFALA